MSEKILLSSYNLFKRYLNEHRYKAAIEQLKAMAGCIKASWEIMSDIQTLEESYGLLCRYALDGTADPQRHDLLADMSKDADRIASSLMRMSSVPESPRQYFSEIRYEQLQPDSDLCGLMDSYSKLFADLDNKILLGGKKYLSPEVIRIESGSLEKLAARIFRRIWTTFPLSSSQIGKIEQAMTDNALPDHYKELLLSAIMLGGLDYFDENRMILLAKAYLGSSRNIQVKAAVGLLLNMWAHRNGGFGRKFRQIMNTVSEVPEWREDLKTVFLELARTRDTERISRKLNEEVIPEMIKIRPDILKKIQNVSDADEIMSLDENPEWADMFEKSGLGDKLKELNDLQSDGGDVMMSTFSHLKSFPFFTEISNWFLPFYPSHTEVARIIGDTSEIGDLIAGTPMMCDSDKYSILLSLERIPEANRRMMLDQFKLQEINLDELRLSELDPDSVSRKNSINKFIQNLYRFFKLYRRSCDFKNPFEQPINLAAIDVLKPWIDDTDAIAVVGEFYFTREYYKEALELYDLLLDKGNVSSELLQKRGFCLQKTGRIGDALEMYLRCEMLTPDSIWTLRHIAQCYRLTGNNKKTLEYLKKVEILKPDDMSVALAIGNCHLESGDYDSALKAYFKVDYMTPDSIKTARAIAWCLFLKGDFERSETYYNRLLLNDPTGNDYMNIGHLNMAMKKYREAANYYSLAKEKSQSTEDEFYRQIEADNEYIRQAGVDSDMFHIVIDTVLSK